MQDLFVQGWKNLWRSKLFWLYSALAVYSGFYGFLFQLNSPGLYCLFALLGLPIFASNLIGEVGLIRTAYLLSTSQQPDRKNTWVSFGSLGVVVLVLAIAFVVAFLLAIVLFLLFAGYIAAFTATTIQRDAGLAILTELLLLPLVCLNTFFYSSSVIRNMGIGKGVGHALDLIVRKFGTITMLNLLFWGLYTLFRLFLVVCILFLQSGYSVDFLSSFGFAEYFLATSSVLFVVFSMVGAFLLIPYQTSVMTLAYVRMVQKDKDESQSTP